MHRHQPAGCLLLADVQLSWKWGVVFEANRKDIVGAGFGTSTVPY
jgi:hypothetical protein